MEWVKRKRGLHWFIYTEGYDGHDDQEGDCQFWKCLHYKETCKNSNWTVDCDKHNSIPVVEYFPASFASLTVDVERIVCMDFSGDPEE